MVSLQASGAPDVRKAVERLARMQVTLDSGARLAARRGALVLRRLLRQEAPSSTTHRRQRLKESIGFRTVTTVDGAVINFEVAWYARYVLGGTKEHEERAGIYTKRHSSHAINTPMGPKASIHHPGARANDFRSRAVDAGERELGIILREAGEGILRGELPPAPREG